MSDWIGEYVGYPNSETKYLSELRNLETKKIISIEFKEIFA
jgi:3-dehydroquinate synthase class II